MRSSSASPSIKGLSYSANEDAPGRSHVLVVIAHPDDEVFASGTICLCASSGFRVALACATDGEGGGQAVLDQSQPPEVMAQVRTRELELSAWALGVSEVWRMGQPDIPADDWAHSAGWNRAQVVADLADALRRLQPQLVLTHGPRGGSGHPAHTECFRCVEEACREAGFQGSLISFCGQVQGARFSAFFDEPSDVLVDVRGFWKRRMASVGYHQTQAPTFLAPFWPTSLKGRLSALFGLTFFFLAAGRRRIPIATPRRFCARLPVEGLVVQQAPPAPQPHFFAAHYSGDPRVRLVRHAEALPARAPA